MEKDSDKIKATLLNLLEDQQRVIAKYKESEKFNRLLFEKSPIGFVICRLDGKYVEVNSAYTSFMERSADEILQMSFFELTPEKYHELDKAQLKILKETGTFGPYEKELITKNGGTVRVIISGVLIKRNDEELIWSTVEDVTKKKKDEELLKESEKQFRSLYENSYIGFYRTTPDGKILLANPALVKMLGFESLDVLKKSNLEIETFGPKYSRAHFRKKIEADGEIKGWEETWLKTDGSSIHVRESAKVVRDDSGAVLYYEGTIEDISESKNATQAVLESEEIFRIIFTTLYDSIFIADLYNGRILKCNEKLSGYKAEEMIGKTTLELGLWVNPEDRLQLVELIKTEGTVVDREYRFRRKDGTIFTGSMSANSITIQNKDYLLSVVRDVTERNKATELLKQSEERFRSAFFTSPDSININRLTDGFYVLINSGFTQITGYTDEDVSGKTSLEINIWADPEDRKKLVEGLKEYGKVENLEGRFKRKDGEILYGLMSASIIQLNGEPHILSITRNITERKKTELVQWELQEELRTTLYSIGDAVISTDKEGIIKQMNPVAEQLTGWTLAETEGKNLSEVFNIICEDNKEKIENPVNRVLRDGIVVGLANHTLLISKDGTERPIANSGAPMRDKEGNIIGVVLVFRDQTEERAAQELLRRNEERMRAIVEGTPNLFFYLQDAEGNSTYVSPTIKEITGYTPERWLKQKDWFITDSEINKIATERTYQHLQGSYSERTSLIEVLHASGYPILLEVFENPIVQDGKTIGLQGVAHDVSARKRAEDALHKTNETLKSIVLSSPLAIIAMDLNGIVTLWNPAAERIFGWSESEAVGKFLPILPENQINEFFDIKGNILTRDIYTFEVKRRRKDNSEIDISVSAVLIHNNEGKPNGILSIHMDITDKKKSEENLKKLSQAIEQSPVSIVITDVNGNIEYVNPKLTDVSGYSADELIGKNPRIFKSGKKSKTEYKELWKTILSGNQWSGELSNKRKDQSIYWESASISPIKDSKGKITHFIAVKEDITGKKLMLEELIAAKNRAEEANATKDLFLANMSHELRTPLIGILGYSDLLTEILNEEENIEMAKGIKRAGKRLLNTLNMILNFTKIESEKNEIALREINIVEEIDSIYKMFKGAAIEKNLQFTMDILDPDLTISIDPLFLAVILENLVNNAIKFTLTGYIKIIAGKTNDEFVFITIKDSGIGIEEKHFKIIFEEFRQISEGINREFQGTGLGLSIAKKYTDMMNGTISIESKPGIGTTFTVSFPIKKQ